jgi:hypothetical protein
VYTSQCRCQTLIARLICKAPPGELEVDVLEVAAVQLREVAGSIDGHDPARVHDRDAVAEPLRFLHIMRGKQERRVLSFQVVQFVPDRPPAVRVQAGGRFVEDKDLGIVHERAREQKPPLHSARKLVDLGAAFVRQFGEIEKRPAETEGVLFPDIEVSSVDDKVFRHREVRVQVVVLGHDADAGLDNGRLLGDVHPENRHRPRGRRHETGDDAHDRGLARAVGAEEPEAFPLPDRKIDAVHGPESVVVFYQVVRSDDVHGLGDFTARRPGRQRKTSPFCPGFRNQGDSSALSRSCSAHNAYRSS